MNPVAFEIFNISIRWYGLAYLFSFFIIDFLIKKKLSDIYDVKIIDKIISFTFLGMIIGGRIGYMIIYDTHNILNFIEIISIWNGGMAAYGGFIGGIIFLYFKCKEMKVEFNDFLDSIANYIPVALFLGRIANLINDEIPGRVLFGYEHPVIIYSILFEGVFLFIFLHFKNKTVFSKISHSNLFFIFYGLIRLILDCFRDTESSMFFNMTYSQLFAILSILIGFFRKS